ncbi:MAG: hypothetical protein ACJ8DC_16815 [Gemmatimonadales bacterium]
MSSITDPDVLHGLLLLAAFLGGILGGTAIDRMFVGFPAWRRLGAAAWAAYSREAAAVLALSGLIITLRAAPVMLSLKRLGEEPHALDRALRSFARWSLPRAIAQALAFLANLWTLARLSS